MEANQAAGAAGALSAIPPARDAVLFTPGPLTTSKTVKEAMLTDYGSRDGAFIEIVADIRRRLVKLGVSDTTPDAYTAIPMQGSGTFGLEAVIASAMPPDRSLLIVINGAYGRRLQTIAETLGITTRTLEYPENRQPDPADVRRALANDPGIAMVSMCHCETTTGILNPLSEVGEIVCAAGRRYFVDAMSTYGGIPVDLEGAHIDYLCSSANKCIEGVPGFSFVIARVAALEESVGWARSVSLDILAQYRGLEENGQFRFTPPVHSLVAFHRALQELETEGGVAARFTRYSANRDLLREGMERLGFEEYLPRELQSSIITSYRYPDDPNWDFTRFYNILAREGHLIYPGKTGDDACFRIGTIGRIFPADIDNLLGAIARAVDVMGVYPGMEG